MTRPTPTLATLLTLLLPAACPAQDVPVHTDTAACTAAMDAPWGVLEFRIVDEHGRPVPGRLTFIDEQGNAPDLFPTTDAKPGDLAVRKNVVYCLSGAQRITVPIGTYTIYATRGLEWSLDSTTITFEYGLISQWTATLKREVDTTGWISGDFHLHTLTYSGHGDSNMPERIISIVGEGVEFAVATDHNHHTDYGPTMTELGAHDDLTAIVGNEVSVPIGHFNAFPVDSDDAPVDPHATDAIALFRLIRAQTNEFGIVPVVQVNHPRWSGIDYFAIGELDPATAEATSANYSPDFDTVEVFNENAGWGYYQAFVDDVATSSSFHSVVRDWFNLLNKGHRYAAVGNSDSHTVHYAFAGYPRNFVPSATDEASAIDPVEVAAMLRARRVFTTIGPFVEFSVNGAPMGGEATAEDGRAELAIRVQAASWVDCDRVKVIVNGDVVETIDVPETRDVVRLDTTRTLDIAHDSWIALLVEGDDPLAPIDIGNKRPIRPLAVVNPVWIDAEGDGDWVSPWERARAIVMNAWTINDIDRDAYHAAGPSQRAMLILAAIEEGRPVAGDLARAGLADDDRFVRLCAARAAERLGEPGLVSVIKSSLADPDADPYLRIALLRALAARDPEALTVELVAFLAADGASLPGCYLEELAPILPGRFVTEWQVLAYFDAPEQGTVARLDRGPETDAERSRAYGGKGGAPVQWRGATAAESGLLDLRGRSNAPDDQNNAMAYAQTWLISPDDRTVAVALGTDDGSRVYLNNDLVYENLARRGANPLEHIATWDLKQGLNRVLFKVENAGGGFGLYFRVLDGDIVFTARPNIVGIK